MTATSFNSTGQEMPTEVDLSGVVVVIPALNEEASLPLVLRDLPKVGCVIVVDNGSTDKTAEAAIAAGAIVVREAQRGYGSACLRGLAAIDEFRHESQREPLVVVFLDADYSDDPQQLPLLVQPIFGGNADFVLGSRLMGRREAGSMPPQSVFGNRLACFLMRLLFRTNYTDLGPFRAIDFRSLERLRMSDRDFGWTVEMQIKAAQHGLRTIELAVPYRCRIGESKISGTIWGSIRAGYKILYLIAKYGFRRDQSDANS